MRIHSPFFTFGALAFGLVAGSFVPGTAIAADPPKDFAGVAFPVCQKPPAINSTVATSAYVTGKDFYDKRNYGKALERFLEAYENDCTKHEVLIIISRTYESLLNFEDAVRALHTFLDRKGKDVDDRAQIETRIASLQNDLDKQRAEHAKVTQLEGEKLRLDLHNRSNDSPREHSITPWVLVGTGGVAFVGGIVLAVLQQPAPPGWERSGFPDSTASVDLNKKLDAARNSTQSPSGGVLCQANDSGTSCNVTLRNTGIWLMVGGVVTAGAGLAWHFLEPTSTASNANGEPKKDARYKTRVAPSVGPGFAGMNLGGTF